MGRFCHIAVVEAVNLIEGYILVAVETEHSHEICILFITAEELDLSVA